MCRDTDITKDYGSILAREAWQIISLGKAAALTLVKHKLFSKGQQDTPTSPQAVEIPTCPTHNTPNSYWHHKAPQNSVHTKCCSSPPRDRHVLHKVTLQRPKGRNNATFIAKCYDEMRAFLKIARFFPPPHFTGYIFFSNTQNELLALFISVEL